MKGERKETTTKKMDLNAFLFPYLFRTGLIQENRHGFGTILEKKAKIIK